MVEEETFLTLLTEAASLPSRAGTLSPAVRVAPDDYPANTVEWLRVSGDKQYLACLTLLSDPDLADAVGPLVRAIIECHGRITWIYSAEGDPAAAGRTRRCRSLCLELGIAKTFVQNLAKLTTPSTTRKATANAAAQHVLHIRQLHNAEGCRCNGRTETGISNTLRAMATSSADTWAYDTWVIGSAYSHHFMPSGGLPRSPVAEDTELIGGPSPYGRRAMWVMLLLHQWGSALMRVLAIHGVGEDQQRPLYEWLEAMARNAVLKEALADDSESKA